MPIIGQGAGLSPIASPQFSGTSPSEKFAGGIDAAQGFKARQIELEKMQKQQAAEQEVDEMFENRGNPDNLSREGRKLFQAELVETINLATEARKADVTGKTSDAILQPLKQVFPDLQIKPSQGGQFLKMGDDHVFIPNNKDGSPDWKNAELVSKKVEGSPFSETVEATKLKIAADKKTDDQKAADVLDKKIKADKKRASDISLAVKKLTDVDDLSGVAGIMKKQLGIETEANPDAINSALQQLADEARTLKEEELAVNIEALMTGLTPAQDFQQPAIEEPVADTIPRADANVDPTTGRTSEAPAQRAARLAELNALAKGQ